MPSASIWLRTPRFDLGLQAAGVVAIGPVLILYSVFDASRATSFIPLATLIAIPFLHVFGSFFFAFSAERNLSPSSPRRLAAHAVLWTAASIALQAMAPRGLATFALLYGGWHIFRQNFGFLRELAARDGLAGIRSLRRFDLAACAAPAIALWMLIAARGPWRFMGVDVHHVPVPPWLLALAFCAVPATVLLRHQWLAGRGNSTRAALLLFAGNGAALLGPALLLDDLTLIYTLSATYHGMQYLAYLAEMERRRQPHADAARVLAPLASAIVLGMLVWLVAMALLVMLFAVAVADRVLLTAWYAMVPFHYFVDGRLWK